MPIMIAEEILNALVDYVPYVLFILFAIPSKYKCSRYYLFLMIVISSALQAGIVLFSHFTYPIPVHALSLTITLCSFVFYIITVKINFFHAIFRLLLVNNIANFISVAAKFIEGQLFPANASIGYCWSYSLCMLVLQIILLIPFTLVFNKFYSEEVTDGIDPTIWRYLCLIPVIFYVTWFYFFYYVSDLSSLEMALHPFHTLFQLFLFLGQLLLYSCVIKLVTAYNQILSLEQENHMLNIETLQVKNIQDHINEVRIMRHDLRHHFMVMCGYADKKEYDKLTDYLHRYSKEITDTAALSYCNHPTLNMILTYYSQLCHARNISIDIKLNIPQNLTLSANEVAVLFGNLLENACDACTAQTKNDKKIILRGQKKQHQLIFTLDNTFENDISQSPDEKFFSTKHSGYGLGTESARNIVTKHGGFIDFQTNDHLFCVSIMLPES